MRKAWFKLTRNATGRQLLWELVTTESGASGYRTTGRINLKRHQMKTSPMSRSKILSGKRGTSFQAAFHT